MRLQVIFDDHGNIIATGEVIADPGGDRCELIPEPDQSVAELNVPDQYHNMTPLQRHERLRVDVSSDAPTLVERDESV